MARLNRTGSRAPRTGSYQRRVAHWVGGARPLGWESAGSKGGRGSLEAGDLAGPGQAAPRVVGACDGHGRRPLQTGRSTSGLAVVRDMALAIAVT